MNYSWVVGIGLGGGIGQGFEMGPVCQKDR